MELLRIFSMLCIVVYHILLFGLDAHHPEDVGNYIEEANRRIERLQLSK